MPDPRGGCVLVAEAPRPSVEAGVPAWAGWAPIDASDRRWWSGS